ncbi:MarR family winged helix-turn-helix transcriptional regulator [Methylocapsa acidiphila]|uniref:MarR family winged helix-turn-helix transcriptional regulator n=1 Tax=Methylocapsa acidiphila TaxID=133552 RepID=UPI0004018AE2|nr:helix-turn-helix domain-containing protein [Methylocapsa acidiphila]
MSTESTQARAAETLTELILEIFRLNGRLIEAGDQLVRSLGLTSARWQVLGAMDRSAVPLSVASIARNKGLSRQAVQRLVKEMAKDGLVRFAANPHHKRAQLVTMTEAGRAAFAAAMTKQAPWAEDLTRGLSPDDLAQAVALLRALRARLERARDGGARPDDERCAGEASGL